MTAAPGVEGAQLLDQGADVLAFGEVARELCFIERLGGGEQQRFQDAQLLAVIGERQGGDVARQRAGAQRLVTRVIARVVVALLARWDQAQTWRLHALFFRHWLSGTLTGFTN